MVNRYYFENSSAASPPAQRVNPADRPRSDTAGSPLSDWRAGMTPAQKLQQRAYPSSWESISAIYLDAVDTFIKARKSGYNPKAEYQSSKAIWEHVRGRYASDEMALDAIVDVICKVCRDYVKAFEAPGIELNHDEHCYPFCTGEMPTIKKLHRFWEECWGITVKTQKKGEDKRAAIEGRAKFAKEAEAAHKADVARLKGINKPKGEIGHLERNVVDIWAAAHPAEFAKLDQQARRNVKAICPNPQEVDAQIAARRGFPYSFWLLRIYDAIANDKPVPTPQQMQAKSVALKTPLGEVVK